MSENRIRPTKHVLHTQLAKKSKEILIRNTMYVKLSVLVISNNKLIRFLVC